ncbi:MAG: hypothetical protein V4561_04870 [Bacteroidota bacterium]
MKQTLLTGWHFMRFLRLGLGTLMTIQFFQTSDKLVGAIGTSLLYQALFNKGCCGSNGCATSPKKSSNNTIEDINFEEVK